MNDSTCQFREAVPTVEDYCRLRVLAGLSAKSPEAAMRALPNTLFGVCAYQGAELVAMGRIVGDGGCHLQVCDIAVLPRLQGQGLGKEVQAASSVPRVRTGLECPEDNLRGLM